MSDDLFYVFGEMFPGLLRPGERFLDGERRYSAAWLDDRRLQAIPDKEERVIQDNGRTTDDGGLTTVLADPAAEKTMPFHVALATFAETVGDAGRINADVHGLPISFFGRDDVENVDVLVSQGRVLITGNLVVGGYRFLCFSEGFPMGAE